MEESNVKDTFLNGVFRNNPVFVLVLGMCPALGVTGTVQGAVATGLATLFVLMFSNIIISLLRKVIPDKVRIPCYIVIISTFVIIVQMVMRKFLSELYSTIGAFIALIVVNCLVLARADGFASSHRPWISFVDGFAMGLGFAIGLTGIGIIREFLTAGSFWGFAIPNFPTINGTASIVIGFFVLACYIAFFKVLMQKIEKRRAKKMQAIASAQTVEGKNIEEKVDVVTVNESQKVETANMQKTCAIKEKDSSATKNIPDLKKQGDTV